MRFLAAIFLAIVVALGPSPTIAEPQLVCLKVEIVQGDPVCVKTGNKDVDSRSPTIDVPVDPGVPLPTPNLPDVPDIELPNVNVPPGNGGGGNGGGSGGSGGSGGGGGINEPFFPGPRDGLVESREGGIPVPQDRPTPDTTPSPSTDPTDKPGTVYQFKDYPWYFWTALAVCALGVGFMLFYDTDRPKKDKPRHKRE
jgi:hypothetical protein